MLLGQKGISVKVKSKNCHSMGAEYMGPSAIEFRLLLLDICADTLRILETRLSSTLMHHRDAAG